MKLKFQISLWATLINFIAECSSYKTPHNLNGWWRECGASGLSPLQMPTAYQHYPSPLPQPYPGEIPPVKQSAHFMKAHLQVKHKDAGENDLRSAFLELQESKKFANQALISNLEPLGQVPPTGKILISSPSTPC